MNKKTTAVLVAVLCMALIVVFGMTATATEPDGSSSSATSVSSEQSTTSSEETNSDASNDTSISSSDEASSGEETSSGEGTTSDSETSSGEGTSSDEETSSEETTSSKPNKPITSGGGHGSTFVDETGSQLASENTVSTELEVGEDFISGDYNEGIDEDIDEYYQGEEQGFVADNIYKIIWIPITIALLCIVGLIVVNVMFKKKYPKVKSGTARNGRNSNEAPKRRSRK